MISALASVCLHKILIIVANFKPHTGNGGYLTQGGFCKISPSSGIWQFFCYILSRNNGIRRQVTASLYLLPIFRYRSKVNFLSGKTHFTAAEVNGNETRTRWQRRVIALNVIRRRGLYTFIHGGGWAEWAAARPLFWPCGPPMCLARPLLGTY